MSRNTIDELTTLPRSRLPHAGHGMVAIVSSAKVCACLAASACAWAATSWVTLTFDVATAPQAWPQCLHANRPSMVVAFVAVYRTWTGISFLYHRAPGDQAPGVSGRRRGVDR